MTREEAARTLQEFFDNPPGNDSIRQGDRMIEEKSIITSGMFTSG